MSHENEDEGLVGRNQERREHISLCIARYLLAKGVPERKQATLVADITGLSIKQARLKLGAGPAWSVDESMELAAHFGDGLVEIFAVSNDKVSRGQQVCEVQVEGKAYAAMASVGASAIGDAKPDDLVACRSAGRWRVLPMRKVDSGVEDALKIVSLKVLCSANSGVRIAVLDDDLTVALSVRDAFASEGFSVAAYEYAADLERDINKFDVFIIDFFLGEETATRLIETIREAKPGNPVLVLTGRAREDASVDAEIARLIRLSKVQVHEKPAQVQYMQSAIESWLDEQL